MDQFASFVFGLICLGLVLFIVLCIFRPEYTQGWANELKDKPLALASGAFYVGVWGLGAFLMAFGTPLPPHFLRWIYASLVAPTLGVAIDLLLQKGVAPYRAWCCRRMHRDRIK